MTMASRGRSTKIDESIESALPEGLRQRGCPHRYPRTYPLQPFHDDRFATGQAGFNHHVRAGLAAGLDALDNRLPVLDDKHVDAFLVGDQPAERRPFLLKP